MQLLKVKSLTSRATYHHALADKIAEEAAAAVRSNYLITSASGQVAEDFSDNLHGASADAGINSITNGHANGHSTPNGISSKPIDEEDESTRLIDQILDLQKTLDDLTYRMDSIKEDNLVLKSENQVLSQYIEDVMKASSSFQQTSPKSRKSRKIRSRSGKR
ncbi:uncharacterized protein LOC134840023 [Symsagittifera roscoffensis]|uniref:uncharacterized protein LOC134840023 n=1 Tax=Symsagittifera roscoffensis TaxID=84072 RepID=UPI00307C9507